MNSRRRATRPARRCSIRARPCYRYRPTGRWGARAALDPELPLAARRISAILAGGRAEGTATRFTDFPAAALDAQVLETALRNGVHWRVDGVEDALLRALDDGRPGLRRTVVKLIQA